MLNTDSPMPLYIQLADILRQAIDACEYMVGHKIPSENELAKQYGVGRPTVRQATDLLIREGALERRRGSGTYVLPKTKPVDLFSLSGAGVAWQASDVDAEVVWLSQPRLVDCDEGSVGFARAFRMQRLTKVDQCPVLLETFYLHYPVFAHFDKVFTPQQSLSAQVKQHYHLHASSAEQSFKVMFPSRKLAELMQVSSSFSSQPSCQLSSQLPRQSYSKTPLLHVVRKLNFGAMEGVIYCDIICRTDNFRFSQTIYAAQ